MVIFLVSLSLVYRSAVIAIDLISSAHHTPSVVWKEKKPVVTTRRSCGGGGDGGGGDGGGGEDGGGSVGNEGVSLYTWIVCIILLYSARECERR